LSSHGVRLDPNSPPVVALLIVIPAGNLLLFCLDCFAIKAEQGAIRARSSASVRLRSGQALKPCPSDPADLTALVPADTEFEACSDGKRQAGVADGADVLLAEQVVEFGEGGDARLTA